MQDALAADVRRHDDDRVLEIDGAALAIGEPAIVEHLQQHVEDVVMGLLDLVEQDHAIGPAANRFGELAPFLEADVAGRGAEQAGHGVLLLIFRHVDADHGLFVVEEELGQGAGQFGFADAGRAQKDERADGPLRILQAGAGPDDGFGHGRAPLRPGR